MILALFSFLFFLFLEAFFALSEMTLITADRFAVQIKAKTNFLARIALYLLDNPERLFSTTIVGITMSITGNAVFTSYFIISAMGEKTALLTSIIPILTFLFGQALPKMLGKIYSMPLIFVVSPILYLLSYLFYPLYFLNKNLTKVFFRKEGEKNPIPLTKFREVFLTFIKYEEEIDPQERELMHRIFEFSKKKLSQVMIPLSHVKALPITATVEQAIEFSKAYNFSYLPLYQEGLTKLVGVVKVQELLKVTENLKTVVANFMNEPLYIPENIPAYEALALLQKTNQDFGIVVDEYGLTTGIITLEDLAEEVLGEFTDQLDYQLSFIQRLSEKTFLVKGVTEIEHLQQIGIDIPTGDYDTLNGFLYQLCNKIPKKGEIIRYKNHEFLIHQANPKAVEEVLIRRVT